MDGAVGQNIFNLAGIGVIFYGLLVVLLLLISKSSHKTANRVLAAIIFFSIWYIFTSLLFLTGNYIYLASFFRIGLPLFYAVPPLILLYVQIRVLKTFQFKYIHILHFLLVLLTFIDSIPFYLLQTEDKIRALNTMSNDLRSIIHIRTGLMPDVLHFFLRPLQGIVYTAITGFCLHNWLKDKKILKEVESQRGLKIWLMLFITLFACIYIGLMCTNFIWILLPYPLEQLTVISLIPSTLCVITFLAMHIFLFFNIHIIFGKPSKAKITSSFSDLDKIPSIDHDDEQKNNIEKIIIQQALFKNSKITAPEMATILGIPPHTFSSILNSQYGKRFPDFINLYRINYVIAELDKGTNENMSIEGIATEAGFASRSAFYTAFKKNTGLTPSEYLKNKG